jgi:hypothetical protein
VCESRERERRRERETHRLDGVQRDHRRAYTAITRVAVKVALCPYTCNQHPPACRFHPSPQHQPGKGLTHFSQPVPTSMCASCCVHDRTVTHSTPPRRWSQGRAATHAADVSGLMGLLGCVQSSEVHASTCLPSSITPLCATSSR